jgi:hydroxysqualene synthase
MAQWTMRAVSVDHYENFPVASLLCPAELRPAVRAIYAFARGADDLADEGNASPAQRLADLAAYRADLRAVVAGTAPSPRWNAVFLALHEALHAHRLPPSLLHDLLDAFEQDVVKQRYADRAELLDYCRRSANPVGRLLLHLYAVEDAPALAQSDAICSALQLINFWQDLGIDTARGRLYVPLADCARHGVPAETLLARTDSVPARRLVAELVAWARSLMQQGMPLPARLGGRIGFELRLVVQGGLRVVEKIERGGFDALRQRPTLRPFDAPLLLWRALAMSRPAPLARGAGA